MLLEAFHRSFPQAPKMWGMLRREFPFDVRGGTKVGESLCMSRCLRKAFNSTSSRAAPTKLVPWSLHITDGFPLLAINRRRVAMNEAVVKSETNSKCTALVRNTQTPQHTTSGVRLANGS